MIVFSLDFHANQKVVYCTTKVKTNNHIQVEYIEEHYRLLHVARSKRSDQHAHQNRWSRDKEICWWNKTYGPLICEPQIQTFHRSCHDNLEFVHQPVPLPEIITLSCNEIPRWSNILRTEKFKDYYFYFLELVHINVNLYGFLRYICQKIWVKSSTWIHKYMSKCGSFIFLIAKEVWNIYTPRHKGIF
jgi:hypothetical protein